MSTRSFLQVIACLPVPGTQGHLATYQQLINNLSTTCQQLVNNPASPDNAPSAATPGTDSGTPRTPVRSACHGVAHGRARTFIPFAPSGPAQRASCPALRRDRPRFAAPPLRDPAPVDLRQQVVVSLCIAVTERRRGRASGAQTSGERVRLPVFALPGKGKAPLSESPAPCFSRASRRWRRTPCCRRAARAAEARRGRRLP